MNNTLSLSACYQGSLAKQVYQENIIGPPTSQFRMKLTLGLVTGALVLGLNQSADAAGIFTDSASFQAALSGTANIQNFEGVDAGTIIPDGSNFGGITFSSNSGLDFITNDNFDTTSPFNALGADDGFSNEFFSGDEIFFDFSGLILAFGLFIIGSPGEVFDGDFQLVGGGNNVFNSDTPEQTLSDGGDVFFLGLIADVGFNTARLNSFGDPTDPFFGFTIDDINTVRAVPEPTVYLLSIIGMLMLGSRSHKRR